MSKDLERAFSQVQSRFSNTSVLVRAVLSGRRRNMQTISERIDIRTVDLKGVIHLQVTHSDGRAMTTKNYLPGELDFLSLAQSGFANILVEDTAGSISMRITKKSEALISADNCEREQVLNHDRSKTRLLQPSDPFLREVGIADAQGSIKASKQDKYLQVEEFLRLLIPSLRSAIDAGHIHSPTQENPLSIVDLGCGHAYLTFATHQYLQAEGMPVKVIGIDVRTAARDRNNAIAKKLGIENTITFLAQEIAATTLNSADVAIALHACDTATDDAIAWAINSDVKLVLLAPCCHHDIQAQIIQAPEPWSLLTRHGIMKERLGDLITDGLRMQILKLRGYRVEAIEFIGGEHTPRNLMIRGIKTGAKPDPAEISKYEAMIALWKVKPALARLLSR